MRGRPHSIQYGPHLLEVRLKRCSKCLEILQVDEFRRVGKDKPRLRAACRRCTTKGTQKWRASPAGIASGSKANRTYYAKHRDKRVAESEKWRADNPEKMAASLAAYEKANKGKCSRCSNPIQRRSKVCIPCFYIMGASVGSTNWVTLSRDPFWAASPATLYFAECFTTDDRRRHKVGISSPGSSRPSSFGPVRGFIHYPRLAAFTGEQYVLDTAGRAPEPSEVWPYHSGRTEVVEDHFKAVEAFQDTIMAGESDLIRRGMEAMIQEGDPEWASYWVDQLKEWTP